MLSNECSCKKHAYRITDDCGKTMKMDAIGRAGHIPGAGRNAGQERLHHPLLALGHQRDRQRQDLLLCLVPERARAIAATGTTYMRRSLNFMPLFPRENLRISYSIPLLTPRPPMTRRATETTSLLTSAKSSFASGVKGKTEMPTLHSSAAAAAENQTQALRRDAHAGCSYAAPPDPSPA